MFRKNFGERKHTIDKVTLFARDSAEVWASMSGPAQWWYMLDKKDGRWIKRPVERVVISHGWGRSPTDTVRKP